jgi:hypothetical protein
MFHNPLIRKIYFKDDSTNILLVRRLLRQLHGLGLQHADQARRREPQLRLGVVGQQVVPPRLQPPGIELMKLHFG